ncbi:MAG: hypothetical protein RR835_07255 [Peptostreptococcaceae bacterium]
MSRADRKIEEKNKKKAMKPICRMVFIITMVCIMAGCVFLVDKEANLMLGEVDKYNIEVFINNLGNSVQKSVKDLGEKLSKLNNLR